MNGEGTDDHRLAMASVSALFRFLYAPVYLFFDLGTDAVDRLVDLAGLLVGDGAVASSSVQAPAPDAHAATSIDIASRRPITHSLSSTANSNGGSQIPLDCSAQSQRTGRNGGSESR